MKFLMGQVMYQPRRSRSIAALGSRTTGDTLQPETEPEKEGVGFQFNGNIHQFQSQLSDSPQSIRPCGASRVSALDEGDGILNCRLLNQRQWQ